MFQAAIKYTNIFHFKALQNVPYIMRIYVWFENAGCGRLNGKILFKILYLAMSINLSGLK
jgi:hypothetical protein